jgi:hypothetical protein
MEERDKSTDRWDLPALNQHPFTPLQYKREYEYHDLFHSRRQVFIDGWWDDMFPVP